MPPRLPARIVSKTRGFQGYHALDVFEVEPPSLRHDGYAPKVTRDVMRIGRVIAILLYDPEGDQILFNQQFRMGPFAAGDEDPVLIECAMGMVDGGEDPEETARREAVEETGCPVTDVAFVSRVYPSPGSVEEVLYLYVGRIKNPVAGIHGIESEAEEIKTHLIPADKAVAMADSGEIRNAASVLLLNWLARHRDRLRREWGVV